MSEDYKVPESFTADQINLFASQLAQLFEEGKQPTTGIFNALVEEQQAFAKSLVKV